MKDSKFNKVYNKIIAEEKIFLEDVNDKKPIDDKLNVLDNLITSIENHDKEQLNKIIHNEQLFDTLEQIIDTQQQNESSKIIKNFVNTIEKIKNDESAEDTENVEEPEDKFQEMLPDLMKNHDKQLLHALSNVKNNLKKDQSIQKTNSIPNQISNNQKVEILDKLATTYKDVFESYFAKGFTKFLDDFKTAVEKEKDKVTDATAAGKSDLMEWFTNVKKFVKNNITVSIDQIRNTIGYTFKQASTVTTNIFGSDNGISKFLTSIGKSVSASSDMDLKNNKILSHSKQMKSIIEDVMTKIEQFKNDTLEITKSVNIKNLPQSLQQILNKIKQPDFINKIANNTLKISLNKLSKKIEENPKQLINKTNKQS